MKLVVDSVFNSKRASINNRSFYSNSGLLKLKIIFLFVLFFIALSINSNLISAEAINDTFHINLQTTFSNGSIQSGTFVFAFNITESSNSTCLGPVVYNYSTSATTDARGIVSIYLPAAGSAGNLSTLNYDRQYYLCYYRDGTLKDVSQLSRVPYSFRATQVNLSEVTINTNLTLGSFNVSGTAGFFTFLGSLANRITKFFAVDGDISNNLSIGGNLSVGTNVLFANKNSSLVGINTSTPQNTLNVRGDTNITGIIYGTNATFNGGWENNGVSILNGDIYAQTGYFYNITSLNVTHQNLTINTDLRVFGNTRLDKNLTVDSNTLFVNSNSDFVGIGTTSPGSTLDVAGFVRIRSGSRLRFPTADLTSNFADIYSPTDEGASTSPLAFNTGAGEVVRISNAGSVGIGTTSPGSLLDVNGTFKTAGLTILDAATNADVIIGPTAPSADGSGMLEFRNTNAVRNWQFANNLLVSDVLSITPSTANGGTTYTTPALAIKGSTGNVGINTTTPQNTLNVIGDLNVTGTIFGLGGNVTGNLTGSGTANTVAKFTGASTIGNSIITDDGTNVGIGTASPAVRLDVNGTGVLANFKSINNNNVINIKGNNAPAGVYLGTDSSDNFLLGTGVAATTRLTVLNSSGNVGIGTTSPTSLLHLNSSSNTILSFQSSVNGNDIGIRFLGASGTPAGQITANTTSGEIRYNATSTFFPTFYSSGVEVMRITTTGNVGIGTASPNTTLDLNYSGTNGSVATIFTIRNANQNFTNTGLGTAIDFVHYNTSGNAFNVSRIVAINEANFTNGTQQSDAGLAFYTLDNATLAERVRISDNGNVGINITDPLQALHIGEGGIRINRNASDPFVQFMRNESEVGQIRGMASRISITTAATEHLTVITNSGLSNYSYVGIGTTSPVTQLHVVGNLTIENAGNGGAAPSAGNAIWFRNSSGDRTSFIWKASGDDFRFTELGGRSFVFGNGTNDQLRLVTSSGNLGVGTASPGAKLVVSSNTNALQTPTSSTVAQFSNVDGSATRLLVDAYGSVPVVSFRRASNTAASPTALTGDDQIGGIGWFGYGATAYSLLQAEIAAHASQSWNDTAQGTYLTFDTTSNNSISRAERLRITSEGNVGIGTTNPQNVLNVVGNANVTGNFSIGDMLKFDRLGTFSDESNFSFRMAGTGGGTGIIQAGNGIFLDIDDDNNGGGQLTVRKASSTTLLNLSGDGNLTVDSGTFFVDAVNNRVGIGTTAPAQELHVYSTATNADMRLTGSSQTAVYTDVYSGLTSAGIYFNGAGSSGLLSFGTNGLSQMMVIDGLGRVGIGTTAPDNLLDIESSSHANVSIRNPTSNGNSSLTFIEGDVGAGIKFLYDGAINGLRIQDSFNDLDVMTILRSGNVGINTTSPNALLEVNGTSGEIVRFQGAVNRQWWIDATNPDHLKKGQNLVLSADPTNIHTSTVMTFNVDGTERVRIDTSGNVSIGTTSATNKLVVSTTANADGISVTNGTFSINLLSKNSGWSGAPLIDIIGIKRFFMSPSSTAMRFYANDATTDIDFGVNGGSSYLFLEQGGQVGIGDTTPEDKLEVAGNVRASQFVDREDTAYYTDPATTSNMKNITADATIKASRFASETVTRGNTDFVGGVAKTLFTVTDGDHGFLVLSARSGSDHNEMFYFARNVGFYYTKLHDGPGGWTLAMSGDDLQATTASTISGKYDFIRLPRL